MDSIFLEYENALVNSEHFLNEMAIQAELNRQKIEADQLLFTSILNNENN
jgi:hypothetical protein